MAAPRTRRILAVKLSSLGDIVLVTSSLRALRRAHPDADLRVAVESRFAPLLAACPWIDGLLEAPSRDVRGLRYLAEVRARLAQARAEAGAFDLALDFQGTRRSAAWVYLSGARTKAGRSPWRPGWRATVAADHAKHAVRGYADVCALVGIAAEDLDPELHTRARDDASLEAILAGMGLPPRGFVLLNTASGWRSKSWDASRAAALATRVAEGTGGALLVTGGEDERAYAERVAALARTGAAVPLAGRLKLGEALCLYRRARLMIACDSGPMHAAAALGTPVVALFGPTHPEHTGPRGAGHVVLQASRPAEHHAYRRDADARHMNALDLETVAEAVFAALRSTPAREAEAA